jgi:DNA-directed RNA polymerase
LSDEVNHILLMLKIIGRKAGVFTHTKTETDPNFIQSLDAYHMRKTINQCKDEIEDLSFWAVHDAFGTHACDVGTMVEIVRSNFYNIHSSLKFRGWHEPRSEGLELKDIRDSEYLIN